MSFLPPSTNGSYRGSLAAARLLTVFSILTIVPGCIHTFAADGGAGSIAGIDLNQNGRVVVAIFAWAGATQIAFGLVMLLVSLRYRSFVPLVYALTLLERSIHMLNAWVLKGSTGGHHPPEHYAVIVALPLLATALACSLRDPGEPLGR